MRLSWRDTIRSNGYGLIKNKIHSYCVTVDFTEQCNNGRIVREPRPQRNSNPSVLISDSAPGVAALQAIHPSPEI